MVILFLLSGLAWLGFFFRNQEAWVGLAYFGVALAWLGLEYFYHMKAWLGLACSEKTWLDDP